MFKIGGSGFFKTIMPDKTSQVILAGGQSSRMARKSAQVLHRAMLSETINFLYHRAAQVMIEVALSSG